MAGLAAIVSVAGQPVDDAQVVTLIESVDHHRTGVFERCRSGPCGVAVVAAPTGPASLSCGPDGLIVGWDGFLDNAGEIRSRLRARRVRAELSTPAELLAALFRLEAEGGFSRLSGDFAAVIWDPDSRVMYAIRDPVGLRGLYWRRLGSRVVVGTELQQVLAVHDDLPELNLDSIAENLVGRTTSRTETFFDGVSRVEPGCFLAVSDSRVRSRRYWDLEPGECIRYRKPREYVDHLSSILAEAVGERTLTAEGTLGIEVSGGLDSSTVLAFAEGQQSHQNSSKLEALVLDFVGTSSAESEFWRPLLAQSTAKAEVWDARTAPSGWAQKEARWMMSVPESFDRGAWLAMVESARSRGVDTILSGQGGDEFLFGASRWCQDLLAAGRFRQLWDASGRWAPHFGTGRSWVIWNRAVRPFLAASAPTFLTGLVHRDAPERPLLSPSFAARTAPGGRQRVDPEVPDGAPQWWRFMHSGLHSPNLAAIVERFDVLAHRLGLAYRHPLLDRELLEFTSRVPEEVRQRGDELRWMQRESIRGLVPAKVQQRRTKAPYRAAHVLGVQAVGPDLLIDGELVSRGWLQPGSARQLVEDFRNEPEGFIWSISRPLQMEIFCRSLSGR